MGSHIEVNLYWLFNWSQQYVDNIVVYVYKSTYMKGRIFCYNSLTEDITSNCYYIIILFSDDQNDGDSSNNLHNLLASAQHVYCKYNKDLI